MAFKRNMLYLQPKVKSVFYCNTEKMNQWVDMCGFFSENYLN